MMPSAEAATRFLTRLHMNAHKNASGSPQVCHPWCLLLSRLAFVKTGNSRPVTVASMRHRLFEVLSGDASASILTQSRQIRMRFLHNDRVGRPLRIYVIGSTLRLSLRLYPLLVGEYAEQTFLLAQSFYSSQRSHQSAPSHCYWTRLYKSTVASVILWLKGLVPCLELLVFHSSSVAEVVIIKWSSVSRSKCFQKGSFFALLLFWRSTSSSSFVHCQGLPGQKR